MKIRSQFIISTVAMTAVIAVVGIISVLLFRNTVETYNEISVKGDQLQSDFEQIAALGTQVRVSPDLERAYDQWRLKLDLFNSDFTAFMQQLNSAGILETKESQATMRLASRKWNEQWESLNEIRSLLGRIIDGSFGGSRKPGLLVLKERYDLEAINNANIKIIYMNEVTGATMKESLSLLVAEIDAVKEDAVFSIFLAILFTIAVVILLLIFVFVYIQRTITRSLANMQQEVEVLSQGDFSSRIHHKQKNEFSTLIKHINGFVEEFSHVIDGVKMLASETNKMKQQINVVTEESAASVEEVTGSISTMTDQINDLVGDINLSTDTIKHFFEKINELVGKIEGQASSVEQSSTSIVEMTTALASVADIATKRRQAGEALVNVVSDGGEKVQKTNDLVRQTTQDVNNILQIIDIINTIADQTNLLAMNASIEAAHAGEAGKGFAVVAQEIRKLAEMTNNNARKIQETIDVVAHRMKTVQESSNESKYFFDHIRSETGNFNIALEEIARAIGEISSGSTEIMGVMKSLSTLSHEIKHDSEEMKEDTVSLDNLMGNIRKFGETVRVGIDEICNGAEEINTTMSDVKKMNNMNSDSIADLNEAVKKFKTGSEEDVASEVIEFVDDSGEVVDRESLDADAALIAGTAVSDHSDLSFGSPVSEGFPADDDPMGFSNTDLSIKKPLSRPAGTLFEPDKPEIPATETSASGTSWNSFSSDEPAAGSSFSSSKGLIDQSELDQAMANRDSGFGDTVASYNKSSEAGTSAVDFSKSSSGAIKDASVDNLWDIPSDSGKSNDRAAEAVNVIPSVEVDSVEALREAMDLSPAKKDELKNELDQLADLSSIPEELLD